MISTDGNDTVSHAEFQKFFGEASDGLGLGLASNGSVAALPEGTCMSPSSSRLRGYIALNFMRLQNAFRTLHIDKSPNISVDELNTAIQHSGIRLSRAETHRLMMMISTDGGKSMSNIELLRQARGWGVEESLSDHILGRHEGTKQGAAVDVQMNRWTSNMVMAHVVKMLERDAFHNGGDATISFLKHDPQETGYVSCNDLSAVLKKWGMQLTQRQVNWISTTMDTEGYGKLNYRAFARRVMDSGNTAKHGKQSTALEGDDALAQRITQNFKHLRAAFRHYDVNKDNVICIDELYAACAHAGVTLSMPEAQRLMEMVDLDGSGTVCVTEFMKKFSEGTDSGGVSCMVKGMGTTAPEILTVASEPPSVCAEDGAPNPTPTRTMLAMSTKSTDTRAAISTDTTSKMPLPAKRQALPTLQNRIAHSSSKLEREMREFDYDRQGGMTRNELRKVCNRAGLKMTVAEADYLMGMFAPGSKAKISHGDFCAYFKKQRNCGDRAGSSLQARSSSQNSWQKQTLVKKDTTAERPLTPFLPNRGSAKLRAMSNTGSMVPVPPGVSRKAASSRQHYVRIGKSPANIRP
jgi:calcium-binding protein CML